MDKKFPFSFKPSVENEDESRFHVTALVSFSKGFACAFGYGTVYMYEKTEDKDTYKRIREIKVR